MSGRSILGPLTTEWVPPQSCSQLVLACQSGCGVVWRDQTCVSTSTNYWIHQAIQCFPPRSSGVVTPAGSTFDNWGVYSPGVVCPAGHTPACSSSFGGNQGDLDLVKVFNLVEGETAVGCCPMLVWYEMSIFVTSLLISSLDTLQRLSMSWR
jgi:hypothetical protein